MTEKAIAPNSWECIYQVKVYAPIMEINQIVKKLKRGLLLTRIWFWAAVHSPYFRECKFGLKYPPIRVDVCPCDYSYEFLRILIRFNRPKLFVDIPWVICVSFARARKQSGEIIDLDAIDNIPF